MRCNLIHVCDFFSDYILLLKSCLKNAYRLWLSEIFGNARQRPLGINEKRTWGDMSITRHVCCGQVSSNNSEVSVPSFSGRPTFTHLSQTPSANSQLSNKYSPIHFRPLRETKGGVKRKGTFWRLSNPVEAEDVILRLQFERKGTFPLSCHPAFLCFFLPSALISSSFPSCHPESHQMSEDNMLSQSAGSIWILKYIFAVRPISLRSCGRGQHIYTEPWWDHLVRMWRQMS